MLKVLWRRLNQEEQGFTLVELMVVVVILGILAGIGIQQFGVVQETARKNANKANVRLLVSAAQMYLIMDPNAGTGKIEITEATGQLEDYIAEWPEDPWSKDDEYEVIIDAIDEETGTRDITVMLGDDQVYPETSS
ncbi:MAG TPA: prepilin-type N-terminal cleavage/methylation domain-containing protein [Firmicutes bacterium]|nr:prepilin-type N-terminal cleavage/methylation domain-containing protein [Bacillota bacterium]